MNWASGEVVGILTFLLPGFISAAIVYNLTSRPTPSSLSLIVQALIFTLICQKLTQFSISIFNEAEFKDALNHPHASTFSIVIAVLLGLFVTLIVNRDVLHRFFRWAGMSRENSYPSEWYSTFIRYGSNSFLVLHLQGNRRLYGFAEEWPSDSTTGHFRMAEIEWLDYSNGQTAPSGASAVLVPAAEVIMVEFLPFQSIKNEKMKE